VRFALARIDSYDRSMWAIKGAAIEEGVATSYGVGSVPIIIDLRAIHEEPSPAGPDGDRATATGGKD
jgi:hypothetical protein